MLSPRTRVAIVGVDSSRPERLLEFLSGPDAPEHCVVTHVVATDRDLTGEVDAVLLCTRDGREHAAQALPLLAAGISVWVDKPLATRENDARAMTAAAAAGGVLLACRSGFRDADAVRHAAAHGPATIEIEGPAAVDSPYGGLAHYGIHHVEIACEVRGDLSVTDVGADGDSVRARLAAGDMTVDLVFRPPARCAGFTITVGDRRLPVTAPARYLEDQVGAFLAGVGQGRGTPDPEALVTPVRLLERIMAAR